MTYYHHQNNFHRFNLSLRNLKRGLGIFIVLIIGLSLATGVNYFLDKQRLADQMSITAQVKSKYTAPFSEFSTPFFNFKTDEAWTEDKGTSTPNVFVYKGMYKNTVNQELYVYVNTDPPQAYVNRVIPVNTTSSGKLLPFELSNDCREVFRSESFRSPKLVTLSGISFVCDPNSSGYTVAAGSPGGTTRFKLKRPNDSTATYALIYKNLAALPESSHLMQIIETFEAR